VHQVSQVSTIIRAPGISSEYIRAEVSKVSTILRAPAISIYISSEYNYPCTRHLKWVHISAPGI